MRQVLAVLVCSIGCLATECTFQEVRLVGGAHQYEGMVEYCTESGWSTVCENPFRKPWSDFEARLACNATGLGDATNATIQGCNTSTTIPNGVTLDCEETAIRLTDCSTANINICHSVVATCTVQNYCTYIQCPNNSECVEELDHIPCSPCQCAEGWAGTNCDQHVPIEVSTEDQHVPTEDQHESTEDQQVFTEDQHVPTADDTITELKDSSNIVVIAVAVVGALLALLAAASLVIAIGIACRHRRKRVQRGERANDDMEMTQLDITRIIEGVSLPTEECPIENEDNISYGILISPDSQPINICESQAVKDTDLHHGYTVHQSTSQKDGGSSQGTSGAYYSVIRDETAMENAEVVYEDIQSRQPQKNRFTQNAKEVVYDYVQDPERNKWLKDNAEEVVYDDAQDPQKNRLPENAKEVVYDDAQSRHKSGLLPTAEYANVGIGLTGDHDMTTDYIKMDPVTHYATP